MFGQKGPLEEGEIGRTKDHVKELAIKLKIKRLNFYPNQPKVFLKNTRVAKIKPKIEPSGRATADCVCFRLLHRSSREA